MEKDTLLVGGAAIVNMIAVTLSWIVVGSVPDVLGSSLPALVGATAALAYSKRRDSGPVTNVHNSGA